MLGRLSACTLVLRLTLSEGSPEVCGHSLIPYGTHAQFLQSTNIIANHMCKAEMLCRPQPFEQTSSPLTQRRLQRCVFQVDRDVLSVIL
jgi:hypothetical protein